MQQIQKKKKKRGLRRYFKTLKTKEFSIPRLWLKDGYFSYDKRWVDYYGFFNLKQRKPHLDCLIRNYDLLLKKVNKEHQRFQIWIWINEFDSYEDCIMLHTPNPFNAFPHKYDLYSIENNFKNKDLVNFIEHYTGFKKIYGTYFVENEPGIETKENFCVLYKDGIGEPII